MLIEVYADIVCPWCYIGERRLEQALAQRPDLAVERQWRPFQLQPHMPRPGLDWPEFAQRKFGSLERAQSAFNHLTAIGEGDDIAFAFDRIASAPNTADAHRLVLFAAERGSPWPLVEALFAAYFVHGRDLRRPDELVEIAGAVGLPRDEVAAYLAGDANADAVAQSQDTAAQLGVQGVPFVVVDNRYAISGAQSVDVFLRALDLASSSDGA